ncbi:hypothetical protein AURDEDRAFT_146570 [Auricularia subglabra TFB-10046 SS5]|uniref:CUE domain-containing protein n=1 Tax=Auricularia subglabra (strain TFB-10046 / SS5) TaxID=717982 RepID=J0WXD9_AURST|nr:hypothetical protein AURDEDRAFT_146570 [Auricularia subglabra TFB-10046 SS5]
MLERRVATSGVDDPRLGYVLATLRSDAHDRALPSFLRGGPAPAQVTTNGQSKPVDRKGKGKAKETPQLDLDDPRITQLADIFPSHSRDFLAKCLHHPSFNGDVDAVVGALLEGNAPPDILQDATPSPSRPSTPAAAVLERRNVFDDDDLDFAKLHVGKTAGDADSLLGDRAFAEQMKNDILRRVQEMSDSDAEADAAADDADDVLAGGVVRVRDGDADSDSEPQLDEAAKKQREIEHLLETEYIRDAAQFARDATTRRSKGREDLRARTGWADEQIEGWAIMLERNPQKAKILAKHEFRGNRPPPVPEDEDSSDDDEEEEEVNDTTPGASQPGRGRGRGRGRGGRGRGGGGGGGQGGGAGAGGGDNARDRARKNARKNQGHRRGRDKKMARVGGPS